MDNTDFRLQRHLKLWEEQSKVVKRTMVAGLLFGLVLILNVLAPFVDISGKTGDTQNKIHELKQEQNSAAELNKTLDELQNTLSGVQETISTQPWMNEKNKLISTLREIRNRSPRSGSWPEYQKAANVTIRTIAEQVRDEIVRPLEESLHRSPQARQALTELSRGLVTLRADMDNWEQDHLGKRWYETFFMKDREMRELTYSLESKIDVISTLIRADQSKIDTKRQGLAKLANALKYDIRRREGVLDELEREMEKILPGWLRGILSIDQMIQLFPFILLGMLVYVTGNALSLTRHHHFVLEGIGISQAERRDPSISSVWTVTPRGRLGTALTLITYVSFALAIWFFFEWGCLLLGKWLTANNEVAWVPIVGGVLTLRWVGRSLFVILLFLIAVYPFYRNKKRLAGNR
jgi:hypothetical protein